MKLGAHTFVIRAESVSMFGDMRIGITEKLLRWRRVKGEGSKP